MWFPWVLCAVIALIFIRIGRSAEGLFFCIFGGIGLGTVAVTIIFVALR